MRMDTQLAQHLEYGRIDQSVAFQFDDDQLTHILLLSTHQILETQGAVDGQPLSLGPIDQCDA